MLERFCEHWGAAGAVLRQPSNQPGVRANDPRWPCHHDRLLADGALRPPRPSSLSWNYLLPYIARAVCARTAAHSCRRFPPSQEAAAGRADSSRVSQDRSQRSHIPPRSRHRTGRDHVATIVNLPVVSMPSYRGAAYVHSAQFCGVAAMSCIPGKPRTTFKSIQ